MDEIMNPDNGVGTEIENDVLKEQSETDSIVTVENSVSSGLLLDDTNNSVEIVNESGVICSNADEQHEINECNIGDLVLTESESQSVLEELACVSVVSESVSVAKNHSDPELEDVSSECNSESQFSAIGTGHDDLESISSGPVSPEDQTALGPNLDDYYEPIESDTEIVDLDDANNKSVKRSRIKSDFFEEIVSESDDDDKSDCDMVDSEPVAKRFKCDSIMHDNTKKVYHGDKESVTLPCEPPSKKSNSLPLPVASVNQPELDRVLSGSSPQEIQDDNFLETDHLRVFNVLDEAGESEEDQQGEGGYSDPSSDQDSEFEVHPDEIDAMLEEGLNGEPAVGNKIEPDKSAIFLQGDEEEPKPWFTCEKEVLIEKGRTPFDILPEGWVQITHNSGMPVYLHKRSRVCCLSRPYFLGTGSTRKHNIPLSAVPCLQYLRELEKEDCDIRDQEEVTNLVDQEGATTVGVGQVNGVQELAVVEDINKVMTESLKENPEVSGKEDGQEDSSELSCEPSVSGTETCNMTIAISALESQTEELPRTNIDNLTTDTNVAQVNITPTVTERNAQNGNIPSVCVEVKTAAQHQAEYSLSPEEMREYCRKRFQFKVLHLTKFRSWLERRNYHKIKEKKERLKTHNFPADTKIITLPVLDENAGYSEKKKRWILNPKGKSNVCILHEYVQRTLKSQVTYTFSSTQNPSKPYEATIKINEIKYGTGVGSSKREAKSAAAKASIEILIPNYKDILLDNENVGPRNRASNDVSFFDHISIEDPRITELCMKASEPLPYNILVTCLQRNFCPHVTDIKKQIKVEMKTLKHQKNEFVMTVGKHTASVMCKNKKEGKQLAAQSILQALHPHIDSWGSLLRLYGKDSFCDPRTQRQLEKEITSLQSHASDRGPNKAILEKLKQEMRWMKNIRDSCLPIGQFTLPDTISLPTKGGVNLDSVDIL